MKKIIINDWDTKGLAPTSLTLISQFEQLSLLLIRTLHSFRCSVVSCRNGMETQPEKCYRFHSL